MMTAYAAAGSGASLPSHLSLPQQADDGPQPSDIVVSAARTASAWQRRWWISPALPDGAGPGGRVPL